MPKSSLRSGFIVAAQGVPVFLLVATGWGWNDLSDFLRNPARAGLTVLALAGALAAIVFNLDLHPIRTGVSPLGRQRWQLMILWLLSLFLLWFLPFADRRRLLMLKQPAWRYVGLLVCATGVGLRVAAMKALGEYFSVYVTLQPDHHLVRTGVYSHIRHPLYLSLLLAPAGFALVFASMLALPILLLAAIFVFDRIRKEELLLAIHFGDEFDEYRRTTSMLLPLVL